MGRTLFIVCAVLAVLAFAPRALGQDSIVLRQSARVPSGQAVLLRDVAVLTGPNAERWGSVEILGPSDRAPVSIDDVRQALTKAGGVHWGRVTLSGSTCEVKAPVALDAQPAKDTPEPQASPHTGGLRDHITATVAQSLGVDASRVRLAFDDERSLLLNTDPTGRRVIVNPTAAGDRPSFQVRVYEGSRLLGEGSVRAGVLVEREVVRVKAAVPKGQILGASSIDVETKWLPPSSQPASRAQVEGCVARVRLEPGRVITTRDVEAPAVVRKGDLLVVDAVTDTIVVRLSNARATADAALGDELVVEAPSTIDPAGAARPGKRASAKAAPLLLRVRIVAPGRAVTVESESNGGA